MTRKVMHVVTPAHGVWRAVLARADCGEVDRELAELSKECEVGIRWPSSEHERLFREARLKGVEHAIREPHQHGHVGFGEPDERITADLARLEFVTKALEVLTPGNRNFKPRFQNHRY
jgi:hypothetical protein